MTMPQLSEGTQNGTLTSHEQRPENLALAVIRGQSDDDCANGNKPETDDSTVPAVDIRLAKRRYLKHLLVMSSAYFFLMSSFFGLRDLQSSLHAARSLGLYALSSMYCSLVCGSILSTTIVHRLGQKRSQCVSLIGFILFSAANFYPRFYTMISASFAQGFFFAVCFTARTTSLTNISAKYAELVGKQIHHVLSQFHGVFFSFLELSQIAGGLLSSIVLSKSSSHSVDGRHSWMNNSNHSLYEDNVYTPICGRHYCPSDNNQLESESNVAQSTLLILMGCFAASTVTGCIIMVFFLDPLDDEIKPTTKLSQQMTAVFRFFLQREARLIIGLSFYVSLTVTFMFGVFTKAYITCGIGIHFVGYVMLTLSLAQGLTSYVSGHLQQYIGRMPLIVTALCLHLMLLMVLYFWSPSAQAFSIFFIVAAAWGVGDGIVITQTICLYGTLFESSNESAFAAHKMCQSLIGFALFVTAPYLCTDVKIFIVMSVLLVALSGYVALEVLLKSQTENDQVELEKLLSANTAEEGSSD